MINVSCNFYLCHSLLSYYGGVASPTAAAMHENSSIFLPYLICVSFSMKLEFQIIENWYLHWH